MMQKFGPHSLHAAQIFHTSPSRLTMAFVNLKPLVPGHVLVSPMRVCPRVAQLSDEEYADLWQTVRKVARVVEGAFQASSLNIAVQDGKEAGQSVPHVHVHILPRAQGDYDRMDDVHEDVEKWNMEEGAAYQSRSSQWPKDEERRPRTEQEMAEESARLRELMESSK
eukprot:g1634.t1